LAAIAGTLASVGLATAQVGPSESAVRVPIAEIRGGKSTLYPVTGSLRQGTPVRIQREEDGWLAITSPAGSSSWIQDRHVKHYPARGGQRAYLVVLGDNIPVHLGTPDYAKPHEILSVNLQRGSIVFPIGVKITYKQTEWWRIEPAPSEVRYVARDAVTIPNSTVVSAAPGSATANPSTVAAHPLWTKAEEAERAGNLAQAEICYRQLAGEMAAPGGDHDLAIRCQNRIESLWRSGRMATWAARQPPPSVLANSPQGTPAPLGGAASPQVASGPGWLRRSAVVIDGRAAYALEDGQGKLRYYLVSQAGLDLQLFLNRPVEVFGHFVPRSDLASSGYIVVGRLHLLR
jgi:hypothetical protein